MKVKELTTEEFKSKVMDFEKHPSEWVFEGERPALIDFYATWCGPCKMTAPIVEQIAEKYDGKVDVYKVDVDKEQQLAAMQPAAPTAELPIAELQRQKEELEDLIAAQEAKK